MNKIKLEHFKYILNSWYNKLIKKIKVSSEEIKNKKMNSPDILDRVTQEDEFNYKLLNYNRDQKTIKELEYSLKKIKINKFGLCETCKDNIDIRRLEITPTANLCIDCKKISEIHEKQMIKKIKS